MLMLILGDGEVRVDGDYGSGCTGYGDGVDSDRDGDDRGGGQCDGDDVWCACKTQLTWVL